MQTFSFNPPIQLFEGGKLLLGMTNFEPTNSVFNITNENNSFSFTISGQWNFKSAGKTIDELIKLIELSSQKASELHVKEVRKKGDKIKIGDKQCKLADHDTRKMINLRK